MKIKLIVKEKSNGTKTWKQRLLMIALGYRNYLIEYEDYKIAEVLGCSVSKLNELELGEYDVGSIYGLE